MATTTRLATEGVRRATMRDLDRKWAAALSTFARRVRTKVADAVAAGQLGPDPEVEVGRWTGARI